MKRRSAGRTQRLERQAPVRQPPAPAGPLVEANQALVLSVLRTQADIEVEQEASALRLEHQRLSEENRQLVATDRLKSEFIAMMSHELRTPLNAVMGFSELLRHHPACMHDSQVQTYLGHIHASGAHLLDIISSTLDIAKAAAGRLDFHPQRLALGPVVAEAVDMLRPAAERHRVRIETRLGSGLDALWLDRTRLKQVLVNYLSNAIKFSHEGGVVTVTTARLDDGMFRLEVRDTGIGIAAADQAGLFRPFHQLDAGAGRRHDGSGLGLAVTRLLVLAQRGSVGLHSSPGVGSVFHAVLPCAQQAGVQPA